MSVRQHRVSLHRDDVPRYVEHDTLIWEYLNSSIHLAPYLDEKLRKIYAGDAYKFYRQRFVLINRAVVQSCLSTMANPSHKPKY